LFKLKNRSNTNKDPGVGKVVLDDIRTNDFRSTFAKEWAEIKEFFLTDQQRDNLEKMGSFKRFFITIGWLMKSLFLKLAPMNRILLIFALIFLIAEFHSSDGNNSSSSKGLDILAAVIFIFIIMLELKDKLLAKTELKAGRSVQQALIPEGDPKIPGWSAWLFTRPANDVGGDLVDYLKIDNSRYGIVLADVVGKGLPAALLMAKLQATWRAVATDFDNVAELGDKINRIFHRDTTAKSFASLAYLELQKDSGNVKILNAGHLPPVIIRKSLITELPKGGPAIGLSSISKYEEIEIDIEKNDIVIIFSDGLTEARNENGEFYGKDNLFKIADKLRELPVTRFGERLVEEIDNFIGEAKAHDDLSIIILKRIID
jgi:sigma-B regulation protein RsbU (phosphoserine phosphatase)